MPATCVSDAACAIVVAPLVRRCQTSMLPARAAKLVAGEPPDHVPSPRQNVDDEALVPLFKFPTGRFPVTALARLTADHAASPRQKVVDEALVPLFRFPTGRFPVTSLARRTVKVLLAPAIVLFVRT